MATLPYPKHSLLFAPMEGVTDAPYRKTMQHEFPEWSYFFTDFLRVPTVGHIKQKMLLEHYGKDSESKRTGFQILTTMRANTLEAVQMINDLDYQHLDLNLGCPSKKVNAHKGGAYLLQDHKELASLLKLIRTQFQNCFTVKIRTGYHDTSNFSEMLRVIEGEGVEAITIHGRTRDQLYQGKADWSLITKAVEQCQVPIIGNGDLWSVHDIERMFEETGCHSVMLGRGALKTPWMATLWQEYIENGYAPEHYALLEERKAYLDQYFHSLLKTYRTYQLPDSTIIRRFKSFCRYLFDDFENFEEIRSKFLRAKDLEDFMNHLGHFVDSKAL